MINIVRNKGRDIRNIIMHSPVADIPEAMDVMNEWMYRSTEVYYGLVDGKPACVWGVGLRCRGRCAECTVRLPTEGDEGAHCKV